MIPFDRIAKDLLAHLGMEADICETEEEAKRKAELLTSDSKKYPIYFFGSDTCGEKSFEEFYTEKEVLDLDSFVELGVIKNSVKRDLKEIDSIFDNLEQLFSQNNVEKSAVVKVLTKYLPNFEHIETGKHLDQKM